MRIASLSPDLEESASDFVRSQPNVLPWQSPEYRRMLIDRFGGNDRSKVVVDRHGKVVGYLSLIEKDGVLNSMPLYGGVGGVVGEGLPARALIDWYWMEARTVRAATVITSPFADATLYPADHVEPAFGQATDLTSPEIEASAHRNVRRAERDGVVVRKLEKTWLDELLRLYRKNMTAIDAPMRSREWFEGLETYCDCEYWGAWLDGLLVSACLLVNQGTTVSYVAPATDPEYRSSQPLAAILKAAIESAQKRGAKLWDWGGSHGCAEGVSRFKRKWGGLDYQYEYRITVNDRDLYDMPPEVISERWPGWWVVPFGELRQPA